MRHIATLMALMAHLAAPMTPPLAIPEPPPAPMDQRLHLALIANNTPVLRAIGGDCAPGTCN